MPHIIYTVGSVICVFYCPPVFTNKRHNRGRGHSQSIANSTVFVQAIYKMKRKQVSTTSSSATNLEMLEPQERTVAIFQKMDTDSDKRLTKDEFVAGCIADEGLFKVLSHGGGAGR